MPTHFIEFRKYTVLYLENGKTKIACHYVSGRQIRAYVNCYVIFAHGRYLEVADVALCDDSGVFRCVPCALFKFIDSIY